MRIITLGRVAGIGEGDDHFYEGSGYVLRFGIDSPEQFFALQLPFIVDTLGIDDRQIMRLELLGNGYSGLRQATVCISFEDSTSEAEGPERLIEKLSAAPSTPPREPFTLDYDELRERLIQFFSLACNPVKDRFLKDSARTSQHKGVKPKKQAYPAQVSGFIYRVSFDAGSPPNIATWRNTMLYCSERLRGNFSPERLDRVTFTAIANSEQEYKVETELLLPTRTRVYGARSELRFRSRPTRVVSPVQGLTFQTGRPEQKLSKTEKLALNRFDELNTRDRLVFWNQHLSKFFR